MSNEVTSPFTVFFDRSGDPLDAGYIYIGLPGINPEVAPITVYWDSSLTTTAAQPIRTLAGYPSRNGSPSGIFVNQSLYSILIKDKNGTLIYSNLNFQDPLSSFIFKNIYTLTDLGIALNNTDQGAAFNAAIAGLAVPFTVDFQGSWLYTSVGIVPPTGGVTFRNGGIRPHSTMINATYASPTLVRLLRAVNKFTQATDFTVDGLATTTANLLITGIGNIAQIDDWVKLLGPVQNCSFDGKNIDDNNGGWSNGVIELDGLTENCGWTGVNAFGASRVFLNVGMRVYRTGYAAFQDFRSSEVIGDIIADKSVAPYTVFGGVESPSVYGSLDATQRTGNIILKSRSTLSGDVYVLTEKGRPTNDVRSIRNLVITENNTGAGFDVETGDNVRVDVKDCDVGVLLTRDLVGDIDNFHITAKVTGGNYGVYFSPCLTITRTATTVNGSSNITITGGSGGFIAPGQRVSGTGIPAGTYVGIAYNVETQSATVPLVDSAGVSVNATASNTGVTITFEGYMRWRNGYVDANIDGSTTGLYIYDCSDDSAYSYESVVIRARMRNVTTRVDFFPGNVVPKGLKLYLEDDNGRIEQAVSGATFDSIGSDAFYHTGGTTLDYVTGGCPGDVKHIRFGTAATVNVDWANAGGWGANRLVGNGDRNITVNAGDVVILRKLADTSGTALPWYVEVIHGPTYGWINYTSNARAGVGTYATITSRQAAYQIDEYGMVDMVGVADVVDATGGSYCLVVDKPIASNAVTSVDYPDSPIGHYEAIAGSVPVALAGQANTVALLMFRYDGADPSATGRRFVWRHRYKAAL